MRLLLLALLISLASFVSGMNTILLVNFAKDHQSIKFHAPCPCQLLFRSPNHPPARLPVVARPLWLFPLETLHLLRGHQEELPAGGALHGWPQVLHTSVTEIMGNITGTSLGTLSGTSLGTASGTSLLTSLGTSSLILSVTSSGTLLVASIETSSEAPFSSYAGYVPNNALKCQRSRDRLLEQYQSNQNG